MYYIYMVRCTDDSLYTGIAADLQRRLGEHVAKAPAAAKYTRSRTVTALEAAWTAPDRSAASRLESGIKRLPREKKRPSSPTIPSCPACCPGSTPKTIPACPA